jgi:DNA-binding CsgD family transcriptional regulator
VLAVAGGIIVPVQPEIRSGGSTGVDDLTVREGEILRLMAKGHTDREIAALLFLSPRTVNAHVAHVLAKLEVTTRRRAVAKAKVIGLLTGG